MRLTLGFKPWSYFIFDSIVSSFFLNSFLVKKNEYVLPFEFHRYKQFVPFLLFLSLKTSNLTISLYNLNYKIYKSMNTWCEPRDTMKLILFFSALLIEIGNIIYSDLQHSFIPRLFQIFFRMFLLYAPFLLFQVESKVHLILISRYFKFFETRSCRFQIYNMYVQYVFRSLLSVISTFHRCTLTIFILIVPHYFWHFLFSILSCFRIRSCNILLLRETP